MAADQTGSPAESRGLWAVLAVVCVAAAAGVGYFVGHSGGADVEGAKAAGEREGRARAESDRRRYRAAYADGRRQGYRQAYRRAYRSAVRQAGGTQQPASGAGQ